MNTSHGDLFSVLASKPVPNLNWVPTDNHGVHELHRVLPGRGLGVYAPETDPLAEAWIGLRYEPSSAVIRLGIGLHHDVACPRFYKKRKQKTQIND